MPGRTYSWGTRLGKSDLDGLGINGQPAQHMLGMVAFRDPKATGGSKGGKYLTFRAMVEGSPGWISPAVPGKHPARTVAELLQPVAERSFQRALQVDVERLFGK